MSTMRREWRYEASVNPTLIPAMWHRRALFGVPRDTSPGRSETASIPLAPYDPASGSITGTRRRRHCRATYPPAGRTADDGKRGTRAGEEGCPGAGGTRPRRRYSPAPAADARPPPRRAPALVVVRLGLAERRHVLR